MPNRVLPTDTISKTRAIRNFNLGPNDLDDISPAYVGPNELGNGNMHYYYLHDVLARAEQVKAPPPNADFSHIELTERKGSDIMRTDARIIYNQVTIEQMDTLKPVSCTLSRFGDPMQFYNFCDVVALYNRVNSVEATVSAPHNETDHEYDEEEHESEDEEEGETDVDNEDPEELDDHSKAVLEMMIFKEMVLQRFWD